MCPKVMRRWMAPPPPCLRTASWRNWAPGTVFDCRGQSKANSLPISKKMGRISSQTPSPSRLRWAGGPFDAQTSNGEGASAPKPAMLFTSTGSSSPSSSPTPPNSSFSPLSSASCKLVRTRSRVSSSSASSTRSNSSHAARMSQPVSSIISRKLSKHAATACTSGGAAFGSVRSSSASASREL